MKRNTFLYYFLVIIIYLLVFQNFLQVHIPIVKYADEALAVLIFPIILLRKNSWKIKRYDLLLVIGLILILITGMYSSLKLKYQGIMMVLSDSLLVNKFFLVYFLFNMLRKEIDEIESTKILFHFKILTILLFILTILNYLFKLYPYSYRYGIMSNRLFYQHPTFFAAVCVFLLCGLIMFSEKINKKYLFITIFMIFTTLRTKAIVFGIVALGLIIYLERSNKKITFSKIGIIAIISVIIAFQQIEFYFIELDNSARNVLLKTSIQIASDYFPLGTGFATFGSYFSAKEYSPIYSLYGISDIYGIQKDSPTFITDSFWPMILGQFGYLGLIVYVILLFIIFRKIQLEYKDSNKSKKKYIAKIIALAYLMISSTSESAFVNSLAIPLAIILGL